MILLATTNTKTIVTSSELVEEYLNYNTARHYVDTGYKINYYAVVNPDHTEYALECLKQQRCEEYRSAFDRVWIDIPPFNKTAFIEEIEAIELGHHIVRVKDSNSEPSSAHIVATRIEEGWKLFASK